MLTRRLRVAALIDLPRSAQAGGHVKCWERIANAAASSPLPLNLTVYFSGEESTEKLSDFDRLRQIPPLFSTARLKFLPYIPDHTDLAPYHPRLAGELAQFDVIHTTDGLFAFTRTAERVSRRHGIPLVTSFHTDQPSYARIFTKRTIEQIFGKGWLGRKMVEDWRLPDRQARKMEARIGRHVGLCRAALVTRAEDRLFAESILGKSRISTLRLGIDRVLFNTSRRNRAAMEQRYGIAPNAVVILFVGRMDVGKNIYMLLEAMKKLVDEGLPLHLITAGQGPAEDDVRKTLGARASVPGFITPSELAHLYASVDGLAMPSEVEIRSMVGVEAMTSGCPVLVSEKSGVADLFGRNPGMRTVASTVDAWVEALRDFAQNPVARERMHAEALVYSEAHIASWRDILSQDLFAVWKEAAKGRKK